MPYITKTQRDVFDSMITMISHDLVQEFSKDYEGKLNYIISAIMSNILKENGTSYSEINKLVGVLECAKLELYRKVAAPYEELKEQENSGVY